MLFDRANSSAISVNLKLFAFINRNLFPDVFCPPFSEASERYILWNIKLGSKNASILWVSRGRGQNPTYSQSPLSTTHRVLKKAGLHLTQGIVCLVCMLRTTDDVLLIRVIAAKVVELKVSTIFTTVQME